MSLQKNILMICYPFPPNPSAGAVRSERFARYLAEYGWNIDVITIKPLKNRAINDSELFNEKVVVHRTDTIDPWMWLSDRVPKNFVLRAVRSILMRIFSFPDHMLLWVPFALRTALRICKEKKIDAIYVTSPPHSSQLAGYILSFLTGIPYVSDFRDPWTLNAYKTDGFFNKLSARLTLLLEKAIYKKSDAILVNTIDNQNKLFKHFPWIKKQKVKYLPNGWEEFPEQIYKNINREKSCITVVHAGTFYPQFNPYAFFYALSDWRLGKYKDKVSEFNEKNVRVILLGTNDPSTRQIIEDLDLKNLVEIKPWVPQQKAWEIMCQADLLLATLGTGIESATYIPSKLYEYIAAKRHILGFFHDGSASRLIRETKTGTVFSSDESLPVIEFLQEIIKKKESGDEFYNPDEQEVKKYHISERVKELDEIFTNLNGKS